MINILLQLLTGRVSWDTAGPYVVGLILALVTGIAVHEFSHALVAYRLGDPTPARMGRVTLNPAAHIDPMWALIFIITGFGMGRPVEFQPYMLRTNPRTGSALVALAGPVSNLIVAALFGLALRSLNVLAGDFANPGLSFGLRTLGWFVYFNLILAFFNLIPIPPLDGFSVLQGILPADMAYSLEPLRRYGFLILFLLVFLVPQFVGTILMPPVDFTFGLLSGEPFYWLFVGP